MNPKVINPVQQIDHTFLIIFGFQVVVLVAITLTVIYFLFRYHHSRNPNPAPIEGNLALELAWTIIPLILVTGMFYSGWEGFKATRTVPADAFPIKAIGKKWAWKFEYPNGKKSKAMMVKQGKPVKVLITSDDVLHSFYLPAFRVKMDAVPGRETYTWFYPERIGTFTIFCAEYCGLRHAMMVSRVQVATASAFDQWYNAPDAPGSQVISAGEQILDKKGCLTCHSTDGSDIVGPTFLEIWGRKSTVEDYPEERTLTVDEDYVRNSILEPGKEVVKGFDNLMPKLAVSDDEFKEIIAFFKTLK